MGGISLTASMRSNLLSLQNISGQVSSTQNKLATGNKVNSAIDNPSSYYTTLSLNNRADDLNALLDSMGQAISTIKAATTALESATDFLEQAKAVGQNMVQEDFYGATKAYVKTKDELLAAVQNANVQYIIVESNINMGDTQIVLSEGQALVGKSYADNDASSVQISFSKTDGQAGIVCNNNSMVSNLKINYSNKSSSQGDKTTAISNKGQETRISNVDIFFTTTAPAATNSSSAITSSGNSSILLSGNININATQISVGTVFSINALYGANILFQKANVNVSQNIMAQDGHIVIDKASEIRSENALSFHSGTFDIYGKVIAKRISYFGTSNMTLTLHSGAELYTESNPIFSIHDKNTIVIKEGALVGVNNKVFVADKEDVSERNSSVEENYFATNSNFILTAQTWEKVKSGNAAEKVNAAEASRSEISETKEYSNSKKQLANVFEQYDELIKDASYKGVNLLQNESLKVFLMRIIQIICK